MSKHTDADELNVQSDDPQLRDRRDFLKRLGKWSAIIIGGVALGGMAAPEHAAGWLNGGGGWVNGRGGGGWVNRSGGGGWVNRSGGGGGGGSWVNRRGY